MVLRLALLGDSMAAGLGATRRTHTPAARLADRLRAEGHTVSTHVFAVPGARSSALASQVDLTLEWRPQVAVIVIGANDLIHHTRAGRAARDLGEAVRRLREVDAEVVVAPAPDLSALPDTPAGLKPVLRSASMLLRDSQIVAARAAGAHVADRDHATAAAFAADRALFADDRFHPSSAGYALISEALFPVVAEALRARQERGAGVRRVAAQRTAADV
ncbi:MAG TPA: SGNH/GDSL hydrolase family protein [Marmoricola sp.]|nr:SGNH/GDSL hydrolase family protein [Marmoricola sp.]